MKHGTRPKVTLEHMWPEETCPVCGKRFMRRCRRSEWGYWYNNSPSQLIANLTLLCSAECAKKFAEMRFFEHMRRFLSTKTSEAIRLMEMEHLSQYQAVKRAGLSNNGSLEWSYDLYWKEIEYLKQHDWKIEEAPKNEKAERQDHADRGNAGHRVRQP